MDERLYSRIVSAFFFFFNNAKREQSTTSYTCLANKNQIFYDVLTKVYKGTFETIRFSGE